MLTTDEKDELQIFCQKKVAGWPLSYVNETTSTNHDAMQQGCKGALAGTILVAGTQTEGRGRLGKEWQSYPGCGLYLSIILRPKLDLAHLAKITLAAGVALVETASHFTSEKPMLKWPNDLYIKGQKCGGILVESDIRNGQSPLVILGIGVNVHQPQGGYGSNLQVKAGSLNDFSQQVIGRADFLGKLIPAVQGVLAQLEKGEFLDIINRWRHFDYVKGKRLTWLTSAGDVVEGISRGIDDNGLLYIIDARGITHEVLSGDVQLALKD